MDDFDLPLKRFGEWLHPFADQNDQLDAGVTNWAGQCSMILVRLFAEFAHFAQHRDLAGRRFLAEHRERHAHRRRIGIIRLVDHQRATAPRLDPETGAASGKPAEISKGQPGQGEIAPDRIDRREHGQRIGYPVLARLCDRVAELALADARGDEGATIGRPHRFDRADIRAVIDPEGDRARGMIIIRFCAVARESARSSARRRGAIGRASKLLIGRHPPDVRRATASRESRR